VRGYVRISNLIEILLKGKKRKSETSKHTTTKIFFNEKEDKKKATKNLQNNQKVIHKMSVVVLTYQ
jgi:hypothetical protein